MKHSFGAQTITYPLPVYLVGSYDMNDRPNVMVAAWGGICSSDPVCLAVSIRPERWSYDAILQRKAFTVSIPSAKLAAQADFFGMVSGSRMDKFAKSGLTPVRAEFVDAPYVGECPVVIELSLYKTVELGVHVQFIGEIKDVKADESCLNEKGIIDIEKADPILYDTMGRNYLRAGEVVAKAWSAGKEYFK